MPVWTQEAQELLKQIPFFVRGKVKRKVEEWAEQKGIERITKDALFAAKRELKDKAAQPERAFSVEGCFGRFGCPHALGSSERLLKEMEKILEEEGIEEFIKEKTKGKIKHHNQFRVALSECPNSCSKVHIADFGVQHIAKITENPELCTGCEKCLEACPDRAIKITNGKAKLDREMCLQCGECAKACPTGALSIEQKGYRVLIGGKLGRRPRLASVIAEFASEKEVLKLLKDTIHFYKQHCQSGERLGTILQRTCFNTIT